MVRESYRNAPPKHKKLGWGTLGVLSWAARPPMLMDYGVASTK
jgi:hypothetical protein